ncbi:hypothetical protein A176_007731 [Myxococcus hansupus]|uniref:Uncharacterized protein n=1 Tax=Pseudomyxococcus hansupus TaxID=1297742 RepID=A0A0H4X6E0_9BACT|nr:hypothetical protein A176_007731 [Myxococcus hansupus]
MRTDPGQGRLRLWTRGIPHTTRPPGRVHPSTSQTRPIESRAEKGRPVIRPCSS